jgi:hypothetical protein
VTGDPAIEHLAVHDSRVRGTSAFLLDAETLAAAVQQGRLSQLEAGAAMSELARRVLADEVDCIASAQSRIGRLVGPVLALAILVAFALRLAWMLGLFE